MWYEKAKHKTTNCLLIRMSVGQIIMSSHLCKNTISLPFWSVTHHLETLRHLRCDSLFNRRSLLKMFFSRTGGKGSKLLCCKFMFANFSGCFYLFILSISQLHFKYLLFNSDNYSTFEWMESKMNKVSEATEIPDRHWTILSVKCSLFYFYRLLACCHTV